MDWAHPDVGLDELVEHVGAFLDIFIVASGYRSDGTSARWSLESLHNAFGWASFLEQVLTKLPSGKEGDASRQALDSAIGARVAAVGLPPGISGLSLSTLVNARSLLVQVLVQALPVQNAWLIAKFVETNESAHGDLWEVVIREMSDRCIAFGSADSLQQALNVGGQSLESETVQLRKVEFWKHPADSLGVEVSFLERWATEALQYITSSETIHKLTGATLIFNTSQQEWKSVFDSLQSSPYRRGSSGIKAEIAELCCLFLASSRWNELLRRLLYPACKFTAKMKLHLTQRYEGCWMGSNLAHVSPYQEPIPSDVKEMVEGYLQNILDSEEGWWNLPPILVAVALAESAALKVYMRLIQRRIAEASTRVCSSDCSCQICCRRTEAQERAWCLLVVDGNCESEFTRYLQLILGSYIGGL